MCLLAAASDFMQLLDRCGCQICQSLSLQGPFFFWGHARYEGRWRGFDRIEPTGAVCISLYAGPSLSISLFLSSFVSVVSFGLKHLLDRHTVVPFPTVLAVSAVLMTRSHRPKQVSILLSDTP